MNSTQQTLPEKEAFNNVFSARAQPVGALLLIISIQLLSHGSYLPLWLISFTVFVGLYRLLAYKRNSRPVSKVVKTTLALGSCAVFIAYYRGSFSVEMASAFLFLTAVLKFLEIKTDKDLLITVYTMLYLCCVSFLFSQSIVHTFLQIALIAVCLYVLLLQNVGPEFVLTSSSLSSLSKIVGKLLLVSIPLVIVFFLFFPRIAPLWHMPFKTQQASTGISNAMSPGDIAELTKSSEIAFRVDFSGRVPEKSRLYWRGLVLDQFDGREWRQAIEYYPAKRYKVDPGELYDYQGASYQVMLEPHHNRWAFSLEDSQALSSNLLPAEMGLFNFKTDAIQATRYKMSYSESIDIGDETLPFVRKLSKADRLKTTPRQDLQRPHKSINPRTQQFVREMKARYRTPESLFIALMKHFSQESFYYTLKPDVAGEHFVDEFLFDSKKGFCAHYAGSLAYMLRLASIPARVVIGYQGGELRDSGRYLVVHQYDAHAWIEVFLPGKGWHRADPTAMVAPERILDGGAESFREKEGFLEDSPFSSVGQHLALVKWMNQYIDKLSYGWQKWVVNYNQGEHQSLVSSLMGEYSLVKIASLFAYFVISVFVAVFSYLWLKKYAFKYTWVEKKYMMWCYLLRRMGRQREVGETPRSYLERLHNNIPGFMYAVLKGLTEELERKQYSS